MRLGKYRHYKGKYYKVIGVAMHTETGKELVIYKPLYGKKYVREETWTRPYDMFNEWNKFDGKYQRRFERVPTLFDRFVMFFGSFRIGGMSGYE